MAAQLAEVAGILLALVGMGAVVAAASMVSLALAVLAAGVFVVFLGLVVVIVAARAETKQPPDRRPS